MEVEGNNKMTLREIISEAKNLKNEYTIVKDCGTSSPSDEAPLDFLKRVFFDCYDRPAFLDEEGYIMLSIFGGAVPMDNIHDKERGDSYYKLYIREAIA